jgi:hypothetical protein
VITAVALELSQADHVPEIHFVWSDENPLAANLNFILFATAISLGWSAS